jgi:hypothetical protein
MIIRPILAHGGPLLILYVVTLVFAMLLCSVASITAALCRRRTLAIVTFMVAAPLSVFVLNAERWTVRITIDSIIPWVSLALTVAAMVIIVTQTRGGKRP